VFSMSNGYLIKVFYHNKLYISIGNYNFQTIYIVKKGDVNTSPFKLLI